MLAWIAGGLVAGLVLGGFLRPDTPALALAPLGVGTVLFVQGARSSAPPRAWVTGLAVTLAAMGGAALVPIRDVPGRPGDWSIEGRVLDCQASACLVELDAMAPSGGARRAVRARARVAGIAARPGDRVALEAELRPHAAFRNPSPHPDWPVIEPVAWVGRARETTLVRTPAGMLARLSTAIRDRARRALERTLAPPTRGIALALVLGDGDAVDDTSAERVRAAGLTHVLAVSGMHVTVVVGALLYLLRRALRRPWIAARCDPSRVAHALAVPLALAYAELAGGSPSAWRAATTAAIAWSLRAAGRRPRALATSALAAITLALVDPASAMRPAFLLSIAATAAVLDLPGELSLEALARGSVRASLATAPLVIWCFEGVPLVSVIANVVLLPIVAAIVLPLATLHAFIATCLPALSAPTAFLLDTSCRGFVAACDVLGAIELGRALPPPDAAEGVVLTLAALGLVALPGARRKLAVAALAALALAGAEAHLRERETPHGVLRATFLDVGQGDAALLDLPDGSLVVVDAGGAFGASADPGARVLVPLLRARRRARIERLVVTHPHPDHYGGVAALAAAFPIGDVWDDGQATFEDPEGAWARRLRALGQRATLHDPADLCGRPREHAGARIEVLWPCPAFDAGWDANDNSLVLRVTFGGRTLLLLGDAEAHAESALLARGLRGPVDVMKVGHHGSRTSSTDAFVAALAPRLAIVSAGVGNRFGHPHDEVVARLGAHGATVLRTDDDGGIVVTTDGTTLSAESWSGARYEAAPLTSDRARSSPPATRGTP